MESDTGRNRARDRRRHQRFADDAQVLCVAEGEGGFHQARVTELSADGMRIATDRDLPQGSQVYAGVFLEDSQEPLVLLGVVQHCASGGSGNAVGLQFLGVTDEQRDSLARLQEYLKRRHGNGAVVTIHPAPAILRIGDESWW